MFEPLRDSLRHLADRLAPEERRRVISGMRDAMVHAKLGIADLRTAAKATETRVAAERQELETILRRQALFAQINDVESVAIAEKIAVQQAERLAVLEAKVQVQQQELALVEREYEDMATQLRFAMSGVATEPSADADARREVEEALSGDAPQRPDADPPRRSREEKAADAESRLADLKRRLGK